MKKKNKTKKKHPLILFFTDGKKSSSKIIKTLENQGFSVEVSKDRPKFIALSEKIKPDLVIFSAYERTAKNTSSCRKFKLNVKLRSTPFIFIPASEKQTVDVIPDLGTSDDFILAPIKPAELVGRITKCLDQNKFSPRTKKRGKNLSSRVEKIENDYMRLIEFNPAAIAIHSEGKIIYANKRAAFLTAAKSPDDLIGRPVFSFVHPDFRQIVSERIILAQEHDKHSDPIVEKFLRLDGSEIDVEVASFPITFKNKKSSIVVVWDITDLKKAESELKESENKFKLLFENLPDAVILSKIGGENSGMIVDANKSAESQTGYTKDEILEKNVLSDQSVRVADKESIPEFMENLSKGIPVLYTDEKTKKDGTRYWVESLTTLLNRGEDSLSVSVCRDITQQKLTEENVLMLSHAVEQSPTLIMITDKNGSIEYVNPKFTEITGYSLEESVGKNPRFLKTGETDEIEYKELWDTINSGRTWKGEFKNKKKNGDTYWESATIAPVKNDKGEIIRFFSVKEDITAIRQLNQQLAQVQKLDSIGTLAGEMAHDFRNIISVINNLAEIINMKIDSGEAVNQELVFIKDSCRKASDLTNRLLTFSRKQDFSPVLLDLNETIRNFKEMTSHLVGSDIEIDLRLSPDIEPIKADPLQLEQILINLTVNARDAILQKHDGEKRIIIETKCIWLDESYSMMHIGITEGDYIQISVSDTGIGMPEDVIQRIFEPFFTTKEKGKGCGLGLSIIYGIVKQNHAGISVYSEKGYGTTLKIYWPVSNGKKPKTFLKNTNIKGGSETILIVDDNECIRNFSFVLLKKLGYTLLEAKDGETALKLLESADYAVDLVLTDIIMPEMNGKELSIIITEKNPKVKFLFCSGYPNGHIPVKEGFENGTNFIQKAFTEEKLARKIRAILDSN